MTGQAIRPVALRAVDAVVLSQSVFRPYVNLEQTASFDELLAILNRADDYYRITVPMAQEVFHHLVLTVEGTGTQDTSHKGLQLVASTVAFQIRLKNWMCMGILSHLLAELSSANSTLVEGLVLRVGILNILDHGKERGQRTSWEVRCWMDLVLKGHFLQRKILSSFSERATSLTGEPGAIGRSTG